MEMQFLLINGFHEQNWAHVLKESLATLGTLEIIDEQGYSNVILQKSYDAIIIDASEVTDPAQLAEIIRFYQPNIPIVVATASPTWQRARDLFRSGVRDYIRKVADPTELTVIFKKLLGSAQLGSLSSRFTASLEKIVEPKEILEMVQNIILFADNDPSFLEQRSEFLEREGYRVIKASNPIEARKIITNERLDLAILDIRLVDDKDDKDHSGLNLAHEVLNTVPKIILTGFPSVDDVREALKPVLGSLSVAVDFVAKADGPQVLLKAVREALDGRRVFVVHGHDEAAKETLARFLDKLDLTPIILHEQSNSGHTVIEKLEQSANVGFAIVLLTPDDLGTPQVSASTLQPRARQNVIFELGYFISKLGRQRVAVLYKGNVEIPSDLHGILYIAMDGGGGWKLELAREMSKAGLRVDLNKAI